MLPGRTVVGVEEKNEVGKTQEAEKETHSLDSLPVKKSLHGVPVVCMRVGGRFVKGLPYVFTSVALIPESKGLKGGLLNIVMLPHEKCFIEEKPLNKRLIASSVCPPAM